MSRKKKTPHKWHKDSFKGICWSANWICLANNWSISLCHSQLTCSQRCYLCTSSGAPEHFGSWLCLPHPTASGSVAGTRGQPCAKRNLDPACNVQSYPLLWFNNLLFVEVPYGFHMFSLIFFPNSSVHDIRDRQTLLNEHQFVSSGSTLPDGHSWCTSSRARRARHAM